MNKFSSAIGGQSRSSSHLREMCPRCDLHLLTMGLQRATFLPSMMRGRPSHRPRRIAEWILRTRRRSVLQVRCTCMQERTKVLMTVAAGPTSVAAKENVQPHNVTTEDQQPTHSTGAEDKPLTNGTTPTEHQPLAANADAPPEKPTVAIPEEKVAITMEEPPPIKNVRTAPGMSATSGPLEDFPEGGDLYLRYD